MSEKLDILEATRSWYKLACDKLNLDPSVYELLKDAEKLEIGSEISQGTMEQTIVVKIGDDLSVLMGAEILLEDGKVIAFRQ